MFYLLLILIFIRPFISSLAFPILNLAYSSILLGCLSIWIIFRKSPLKEIRPILLPLISFALSLVACAIFSFNKTNSFYEVFYKYVPALLIFIIGASLPDKKKAQVLKTLIGTCFIVSIITIYQYLFGFRHLLDYMSEQKISDPFILDYISQKRAFFPFTTPNALAGYIALIMPLALTISGKKKWIIITAIALPLLLTKSLGVFLSLFLGACFYLCIHGGLSKKKFAMLLAIAAGTITVFFLRQTSGKGHILPSFSLMNRLDYWGQTLGVIKNYFFWGIGPGNFNLHSSRYGHNSYLQAWAEMGIPGIITLFWLLFKTIKIGMENFKKSTKKNEIAFLLTSSIIFLSHNLLDFTFFLPEIAWLWWVILGMTGSAQK